MRHSIAIFTLAALILFAPGCEPKRSNSSAGPTSDSQLLLLDDDPGNGNGASSQGADNSRCHVCHMNFAKEEIAVKHARAGIGCNKCHGESDEHIADESWAMGGTGTAPDIMFSRSDVVAACMKCHPKEMIGEARHKEVLSDISDKVCTDCHGKHKMADRRFQWK